MKTLACMAIALGTLASPVLSLAQSTAPLTRAEVRAELIRVEKAGYIPSSGDEVNYPADIQAAEAKIAAENNSQTMNDAIGGMPMKGNSAAGAPTQAPKPVASSCVAPVSYCNIYFGN